MKKEKEFVIKKGMAIPERKHGLGRPLKYPWDRMKAGDCVDTGLKVKGSGASAGAQMARNWAKRQGYKCTYVQRVVGDTIWVWRTK